MPAEKPIPQNGSEQREREQSALSPSEQAKERVGRAESKSASILAQFKTMEEKARASHSEKKSDKDVGRRKREFIGALRQDTLRVLKGRLTLMQKQRDMAMQEQKEGSFGKKMNSVFTLGGLIGTSVRESEQMALDQSNKAIKNLETELSALQANTAETDERLRVILDARERLGLPDITQELGEKYLNRGYDDFAKSASEGVKNKDADLSMNYAAMNDALVATEGVFDGWEAGFEIGSAVAIGVVTGGSGPAVRIGVELGRSTAVEIQRVMAGLKTIDQAAQDAVISAISNAVGAQAAKHLGKMLQAGAKTAKFQAVLTKAAHIMKKMIENPALRKGLQNTAVSLTRNATEGAIDGAVGGAAHGTVDAVRKDGIGALADANTYADAAGQSLNNAVGGAAGGAVMGTAIEKGLPVLGKLAQKISGKIRGVSAPDAASAKAKSNVAPDIETNEVSLDHKSVEISDRKVLAGKGDAADVAQIGKKPQRNNPADVESRIADAPFKKPDMHQATEHVLGADTLSSEDAYDHFKKGRSVEVQDGQRKNVDTGKQTGPSKTAVIGDMHIGGGTEGEWFDGVPQANRFLALNRKLRSMNEAGHPVKTIVDMGDFLDKTGQKFEKRTDFREKAEAVARLRSKLAQGAGIESKNYYVVTGNHDLPRTKDPVQLAEYTKIWQEAHAKYGLTMVTTGPEQTWVGKLPGEDFETALRHYPVNNGPAMSQIALPEDLGKLQYNEMGPDVGRQIGSDIHTVGGVEGRNFGSGRRFQTLMTPTLGGATAPGAERGFLVMDSNQNVEFLSFDAGKSQLKAAKPLEMRPGAAPPKGTDLPSDIGPEAATLDPGSPDETPTNVDLPSRVERVSVNDTAIARQAALDLNISDAVGPAQIGSNRRVSEGSQGVVTRVRALHYQDGADTIRSNPGNPMLPILDVTDIAVKRGKYKVEQDNQKPIDQTKIEIDTEAAGIHRQKLSREIGILADINEQSRQRSSKKALDAFNAHPENPLPSRVDEAVAALADNVPVNESVLRAVLLDELSQAGVNAQAAIDRAVRQFATPGAEVHNASNPDAMVTAYLDGLTGSNLNARQLSADERLVLAYQYLTAAQNVTDSGYVSRDMKPSNFQLMPDGTVRILDLGSAVKFKERPPAPEGTLATIAPEQFTNAPLTDRSDVYSLGAMLYQLSSGTNNFPAEDIAQKKAITLDTIFDTTDAVMKETITNNVADQRVHALLEQMLKKNPQDRISIQEARAQLKEILGPDFNVNKDALKNTVRTEMMKRKLAFLPNTPEGLMERRGIAEALLGMQPGTLKKKLASLPDTPEGLAERKGIAEVLLGMRPGTLSKPQNAKMWDAIVEAHKIPMSDPMTTKQLKMKTNILKKGGVSEARRRILIENYVCGIPSPPPVPRPRNTAKTPPATPSVRSSAERPLIAPPPPVIRPAPVAEPRVPPFRPASSAEPAVRPLRQETPATPSNRPPAPRPQEAGAMLDRYGKYYSYDAPLDVLRLQDKRQKIIAKANPSDADRALVRQYDELLTRQLFTEANLEARHQRIRSSKPTPEQLRTLESEYDKLLKDKQASLGRVDGLQKKWLQSASTKNELEGETLRFQFLKREQTRLEETIRIAKGR